MEELMFELLTDGPDLQTFSPGSVNFDVIDAILGLRGSDTITGSSDNETIRGGRDNDQIFAEGGNDRLLGDRGADLIQGGVGDDIIRGGRENDLIDGGAGNDIIFGDRGPNIIQGSEGADVFVILDESSSTDTSWDTVIDFEPLEQDRLILLGNFTMDELIFREFPNFGTNIITEFVPSGIQLTSLLTLLDPDFVPQSQQGINSTEILAPNGERLGLFAFASPQEIMDNLQILPITTTEEQILGLT